MEQKEIRGLVVYSELWSHLATALLAYSRKYPYWEIDGSRGQVQKEFADLALRMGKDLKKNLRKSKINTDECCKIQADEEIFVLYHALRDFLVDITNLELECGISKSENNLSHLRKLLGTIVVFFNKIICLQENERILTALECGVASIIHDGEIQMVIMNKPIWTKAITAAQARKYGDHITKLNRLKFPEADYLLMSSK